MTSPFTFLVSVVVFSFSLGFHVAYGFDWRLSTDRQHHWFDKVFHPLLSSLNDTQLLAGLDVMTAGWIHVREGLAVYHFTIISDLAWMTSNTQLTCHSTLRHWGKRCGHTEEARTPRVVRAILVFSHCVMLFCATTIQSRGDWWESINCSVKDFVDHPSPGGIPKWWMLANYFMLLWGSGAAIIPLFQPTKNIFKAFEDLVAPKIPDVIMPTVMCPVKFLDSMIFDIMFSITWFSIVVRDLRDDRKWGNDYFKQCSEESEDSWGFGQILPMNLLILPILVALDGYSKLDPSPGFLSRLKRLCRFPNK